MNFFFGFVSEGTIYSILGLDSSTAASNADMMLRVEPMTKASKQMLRELLESEQLRTLMWLQKVNPL